MAVNAQNRVVSTVSARNALGISADPGVIISKPVRGVYIQADGDYEFGFGIDPSTPGAPGSIVTFTGMRVGVLYPISPTTFESGTDIVIVW